jgi:hypothetical protein
MHDGVDLLLLENIIQEVGGLDVALDKLCYSFDLFVDDKGISGGESRETRC